MLTISTGSQSAPKLRDLIAVCYNHIKSSYSQITLLATLSGECKLREKKKSDIGALTLHVHCRAVPAPSAFLSNTAT